MSDDGIRLGNYDRPHLRVAPGTCRRCGNAILSVGDLCTYCMNQVFLDEVLAQQRQILKDDPRVVVSIARDHQKQRHVALVGHKGWSFCRLALVEPEDKRLRVPATMLPSEMCGFCRKIIEEAQKGVASWSSD